MAFPLTDFLPDSRFIPADTIRRAESEGGLLITTDDAQGRTAGHYRIHAIITDAQATSLESDYDTNAATTFTITWPFDSPATTPTVFYRDRPQITPIPEASHLYEAVVLLEVDVQYGSRVLEDFTTRTLEDGTTRNLEAA